MESLLFLIIGIFVIIISIIFIASQPNQNNVSEEVLKQDDELVITIESLENIIGDINDTFNDTIKEMEKKYESLDSKIQYVDNKVVEKYEHSPMVDLEKEDNYENSLNYIDNQNKAIKNNIEEQDKEINNNINSQSPEKEKDNFINIKSSKIMELKNRGLSVQQIAKELNIGTGEIMLILNLRRFK